MFATTTSINLLLLGCDLSRVKLDLIVLIEITLLVVSCTSLCLLWLQTMLLIVVYSCLFVFFMRRLFGTKCAKCSQGFSKNDCVMRARNKIYHIDCFRCLACARQLIPGDEFALRENGLFCKADHDVLERTTPDATTVMMVNNNNNGNHQNFMNSEYD